MLWGKRRLYRTPEPENLKLAALLPIQHDGSPGRGQMQRRGGLDMHVIKVIGPAQNHYDDAPIEATGHGTGALEETLS